MNSVTGLLTAEVLWNLPENGGRCELVRGTLREFPYGDFEHGAVSATASMLFGTYVHDRKLGISLAANTGFLVARDPDTVLAPDFAFVRAKRVPPGPLPDGYWIGPPDLALETVSFSDTAAGIERKAEEWLNAGCQLVWVVHPRQKTVTVYRPQEASRTLGVDDTLTGEDIVPGFQITVAEIFA